MEVVAEEEGVGGGGGGDQQGDCFGEVFVVAGLGLDEIGLGFGFEPLLLASPSAPAFLGGSAGLGHSAGRLPQG